MLLRVDEVTKLVNVTRPSLYRWLRDPRSTFPKPIKVGRGRTGAVRWKRDEIVAWIESCPRTGEHATPKAIA